MYPTTGSGVITVIVEVNVNVPKSRDCKASIWVIAEPYDDEDDLDGPDFDELATAQRVAGPIETEDALRLKENIVSLFKNMGFTVEELEAIDD